MTLNLDAIPFGMSDIIVGTGADAVNFDGIDELQAEGGEVSFTPILEDVNIADYGNGVYDQRIVGYEGSVTINAAQESLRVLQLALAGTETITDAGSAAVVGITDAAMGSSLRAKGKPVSIHPRNLPKSNKERDINIYKMVASGDFTRTSGNSQGTVTITLTMLPKDGMDPSKPGNFFYIGSNPGAVPVG